MKRLVTEVLLLGVIFLSFPAHAQEEEEPPTDSSETIEFNEEQRRLNNKATKALGEEPPDTETAVRNIEAALAAGDAGNVLYLSLGRAHQKAGRCERAQEAFEKARAAPAVEGVPNDAVLTRLDRFIEELDQCFGTLRVACESPDDTRLRVSGRDVKCDESVVLDPAKHIVTARRNMQRVDIPVDVEGGKEARVHVDLTSEDAEPAASVWEAATGRTNLALGVAKDVAERRAEEEQRRQRDAAAVSAQITSERVALSAERLIGSAQRPAGDPQVAGSTQAGVADVRKQATAAPEQPGDLTLQFALLAPLGGFGLKASNGFDDGGLVYGVTGDAVARYAGSRMLGADVHLLFDYTLGEGLGFKKVDGTDGQTLDQQYWRFLGETRAWLLFFGVGVFANHRSQTMIFEDGQSEEAKFWAGGPSLTISTSEIARTDAYFDLILRWAPLFDGDVDHLMAGFEVATGYLMVSLFYEYFSTEEIDDGALVAGETLLLRFGARVPFKTNLSSEPPTTAELEVDQ